MLKKLLVVVALIVFAYLGAKAFLHYRIAQTLDATLDQTRATAAISYESVTSSLTGRVGVAGLVITPPGVKDRITIAEITLQFPDIWYLWQLDKHMTAGELPDQLSFHVKDLVVDPFGDIIEARDDAVRENSGPDVDRHCVARSTYLYGTMFDLGYTALTINTSGGFDLNPGQGALRIHGEFEIADAQKATFEMAFPAHTNDAQRLMMSLADPAFLNAVVTLEDLGQRERIYAYCSRDGVAEADAINLMIEELVNVSMGFGILPDAPLLDDYRRYLEGGNSLTVRAQPWEPKKFSEMSMYKPEDMPDLLNISTEVR